MKHLFRFGAGVRLVAILALVVMIGLPMSVVAQEQTMLPTPTVLSPMNNDRAVVAKPLFDGVTKNKTRVAVYIDGVFNGDADVKGHRSGTASWSYEPFLDLKPGKHEVRVRSIDSESKMQSEISLPVKFEVEAPLPSPIVLSAVVNDRTTSLRPFITGVAPADTHLEIFIDGQLNGNIHVNPDASGTGSFSYLPFLALDPGSYVVMARAIDEHGKRSEDSASFAFRVRSVEPTVTADEETIDEVSEDAEDADADETDDQAAPEEEGEILGEAVTEEKSDDKQASTNENSNVNASDESKDEEDSAAAASTDDDSSNNSTIGWVILGLIVLALLWRGRKTLFGEGGGDRDIIKEQHRSSSSQQPPLWKSAESGSSVSNGRDHSVNNDSDRPTPPPPPPASSY